MFRWVDKGPDNGGISYEPLEKETPCIYLIDEVCCNGSSDMRADFPAEEYCKNRCPHIERPRKSP